MRPGQSRLFRPLTNETLGGDAEHRGKLAELRNEIDLQLIAAEREAINDLYCGNKLTDEARRQLERELDLGEANVANSRDEE
jgi:monovalent cation/hydrogen antiporter